MEGIEIEELSLKTNRYIEADFYSETILLDNRTVLKPDNIHVYNLFYLAFENYATRSVVSVCKFVQLRDSKMFSNSRMYFGRTE